MATENAMKCVTYPASADLSAAQYRFVTLNTSGQLVVAGDGARAIGVLQDKPDAQGRAGQVCIGGETKVRFGAAAEEGVALSSDASGDAVTATTGEQVLGIVSHNPGGALIGSMIFQPQGVVPA